MDAILKTQAEQLAHQIATQATTLEGLNGLMRTMMKTALEAMLPSELDVHLGRRASTTPSETSTTVVPTEETSQTKKNRRNGHSQKTVQGDMEESPSRLLGIAMELSNPN